MPEGMVRPHSEIVVVNATIKVTIPASSFTRSLEDTLILSTAGQARRATRTYELREKDCEYHEYCFPEYHEIRTNLILADGKAEVGHAFSMFGVANGSCIEETVLKVVHLNYKRGSHTGRKRRSLLDEATAGILFSGKRQMFWRLRPEASLSTSMTRPRPTSV